MNILNFSSLSLFIRTVTKHLDITHKAEFWQEFESNDAFKRSVIEQKLPSLCDDDKKFNSYAHLIHVLRSEGADGINLDNLSKKIRDRIGGEIDCDEYDILQSFLAGIISFSSTHEIIIDPAIRTKLDGHKYLQDCNINLDGFRLNIDTMTVEYAGDPLCHNSIEFYVPNELLVEDFIARFKLPTLIDNVLLLRNSLQCPMNLLGLNNDYSIADCFFSEPKRNEIRARLELAYLLDFSSTLFQRIRYFDLDEDAFELCRNLLPFTFFRPMAQAKDTLAELLPSWCKIGQKYSNDDIVKLAVQEVIRLVLNDYHENFIDSDIRFEMILPRHASLFFECQYNKAKKESSYAKIKDQIEGLNDPWSYFFSELIYSDDRITEIKVNPERLNFKKCCIDRILFSDNEKYRIWLHYGHACCQKPDKILPDLFSTKESAEEHARFLTSAIKHNEDKSYIVVCEQEYMSWVPLFSDIADKLKGISEDSSSDKNNILKGLSLTRVANAHNTLTQYRTPCFIDK